MWLLGAIFGLIVGGLTGSMPAAFVIMTLGGVVAHQLGKSSQSQSAQAKRDADSLHALRQTVSLLETRLSSVERQLAQRFVVDGAGLAQKVAAPSSKEEAPTPAAEATKVAEATISDLAKTGAQSETMSTMPAAKSLDTARVMPSEKIEVPAATSKLPSATPTLTTDAATRAVQATPPVQAAPAMASTTSSQQMPKPRPATKPPEPVIPFKDRLPTPLRNFIYGGNTLVKMGVLILFLGLAFLLRYTAERITVPIELRYTGVAMVGVGLLALGWFLRRRRADYALILQGMGVGVFYLTTLSAMKFHALIPSEMGFAFMFAVSILGAALAIMQKAPALAIIAALEGFATPILTSTGGNHMMGLFTYLSILNLGIVLVAWFNAWRILNLIGFVGTFFLASGWAKQYYTADQYEPVQAFLILFFLLFTATGVFFARRTLLDAKTSVDQSGSLAQQAGAALSQVGRVDSALVFGTPITAFGMQYLLTKQWEFGPAYSAMIVAAFYLILARWIFSRERVGLALLAEAYAIVAVIFATLAIPLGLEGVWTCSAWAVEGAGMYWLGVRQQRPYARAFAYLVLGGATYQLLHAMSFNAAPGGALLQGSTIGPVLLALSALAMWGQHRRAQLDSNDSAEYLPGKCLPWLGIAALSILPWQWFVPPMAAAATAMLSVATYFVARRLDLKPLLAIVACLQAVAVAAFLSTLHRTPLDLTTVSQASMAVLDSGTQGILAALMIAGSILLTAGWSMARARRAALANGLPPAWSMVNSMSVVVGTSLLHLAMLFALSFQQAVVIWPLTSCLVLWVALRMSHTTLASVAGALQVISAALFLLKRDLFDALDATTISLPAFAHTRFIAPLLFGIVAILCGDWIRVEAKRFFDALRANQADTPLVQDKIVAWLNPWCTQKSALGLPIAWGLFWWLTAWCVESKRIVELRSIPEFFTAALVTIVITTSLLVIIIARWRNWQQMGLASLFTVPALILTGLLAVVGPTTPFLPSAYLGWLLWPAALIWHLRLLHMQGAWSSQGQRHIMHVLGFWFFLLLAAREGQVRLGLLGDPSSSWALLGWILAPAFSLWLMTSSFLAKRWPLTEFRYSYLATACTPVALYLFGWCFLSNIVSAGNASPLPYLPLFNPLELAQWMILGALLLWWRASPDKADLKLSSQSAQALGSLMALALLTGMVLRSCHHFAGVAWSGSALFDSRLTQAALSITWGFLGVLTMVFGNRRASRNVWAAGAILLGIVVVKLFALELADHGGLYRIVSFIGVGMLLLAVGYFAPVPVKSSSVPTQ